MSKRSSEARHEEARAVYVRQMKPCPFCGHQPDASDPLDVIYPVGRSPDLWQGVCQTSHGGCSAHMLGATAADVVERWNRRVPT